MLLLILLAFCHSGRSITTQPPPQHVARIELNTWVVDDERGVETKQFIIWRIHPEDGQYHVAEWFIADRQEDVIERGGKFYWSYVGSIDNKRHRIVADSFLVTHTNRDPERWDKTRWPESKRIRLIGMEHLSKQPPVPCESGAVLEGLQ